MEERPPLAREFDRLRAASRARLFEARPEARESVGRFRLLRRLGQGGMGVVWAAHDPELEREVAIKILHRRRGDDEGRLRRRWLREARALAKVSHPNVVQVFEVGSDQGDAHLAMELVRGRTLRGFDVEHGHTREEVIDAYLQAARGLAAAHAAGLVHRDFKPDNALRSDDGRVRVVDFGLARAAGDDSPTQGDEEPEPGSSDERITRTGTVLGTPAYMAPEQRAAGRVDARSDQYSWCVSLFEALHGRRPEPGDHSSSSAGDDRVTALLRRGLAEAPESRWPSMDAVVVALEELTRPRSRRWWWPVGLAVVGLAVVGLAVVGLWPRSELDPACDQAREAMAVAWSEARARKLDEHLREVAPAVAERSSARLRASFDGLAAKWRELAARTCAARPLGAGEHATLRCLRSRADLLDAVVSALHDAPAERLAELDRVLELPSVQDCAHPDRMQQRMPLPAGDDERRRVQSLRLALAQADLQRRLGDPVAAIDALDALGPEVEATAFVPLRAEHQLARAEALVETGRYVHGRRAAEEAVALAKRASTPVVEAHGWILLGLLDGYIERHAEAGARNLDLAEAALDQAGGDPRLEVLVVAYRGHVSLGAGRLEEALAAHRRALELERARAEASRLEAQLLEIIGTVLRRMGRLDEAEAQMQQAHAVVRQRLGPEHPKTAASVMALGNLALQRDEPAVAIERYEQARGVLTRSSSEILPRLLNNLGQAYTEVERYDDAERTLEEALRVYEARDDETIEHARARSSLARALRLRGRVAQSLVMAESAVARAERAVGPDHPELARIVLNRALVHEELGDATAAEHDARRVLELADADARSGPSLGARRLLDRLDPSPG